jgi:hypothetical protein
MILGIAAALCLTGACATTANYERRLQGWIDRPAEELVTQWGYPDDQITLPNNNVVYVYRNQISYAVPGEPYPWYRYPGRPYPIYEAPYVLESSCTTFFEVDSAGKIIKWQWKGNGCAM